MVKIRNNDIDEKDIIAYIKVDEIHRKEKLKRSKEFNKTLSTIFSAFTVIAYMFIYASVFVAAQYGIMAFVNANPNLISSPIMLLIGLWVSYGMLVLYLVNAYTRGKE